MLFVSCLNIVGKIGTKFTSLVKKNIKIGRYRQMCLCLSDIYQHPGLDQHHSTSLKMAPFDRPVYDVLLVCHCKYSLVQFFELFDMEECCDLQRSVKVIGNNTIQ